MKKSTEEAERWDRKQKPASLWWTDTNADKTRDHIMIKTQKGMHKFPFDKNFNFLKFFCQSSKECKSR